MKKIFFGAALICLLMAIGKMPTHEETSALQNNAALTFAGMFIFFSLLAILFKWIQEKIKI